MGGCLKFSVEVVALGLNFVEGSVFGWCYVCCLKSYKSDHSYEMGEWVVGRSSFFLWECFERSVGVLIMSL